MIKIIAIRKDENFHGDEPHLGVTAFKWVNEQDQTTGETSLRAMYDWIVNKKGKAFIRDSQGNQVFIFGAISNTTGQQYLRAAQDGRWTDDLLSENIPAF